MSGPERRRLAAFLSALLLAGCSWIPFIGDDGPHLTNPAVEACRAKARDAGYDGVSERQSAPGKDGSYSVTLDVLQSQGYGQITCAYDPKKGASVPPLKATGK